MDSAPKIDNITFIELQKYLLNLNSTVCTNSEQRSVIVKVLFDLVNANMEMLKQSAGWFKFMLTNYDKIGEFEQQNLNKYYPIIQSVCENNKLQIKEYIESKLKTNNPFYKEKTQEYWNKHKNYYKLVSYMDFYNLVNPYYMDCYDLENPKLTNEKPVKKQKPKSVKKQNLNNNKESYNLRSRKPINYSKFF